MRKLDRELQKVVNKIKRMKVGDLEINYEYETVDTVPYLEIYKDGKNRPIDVFMGDCLNVETIKQDYPQFFIKAQQFK